MSTLATAAPPQARTKALFPFAAAAAAFAATGIFDLLARPPLDDHAHHGASAYAMTVLLIPFALTQLLVVREIRRGVDDRGGRLASAGFNAAAAGLLLFIPCAIAALATANPRALGPVYMLAMLASLVGTILLTAAAARVRALPVWAAIAMPLAWLICGPAGEGGIMRGAAIILAGVTLAVAERWRKPYES